MGKYILKLSTTSNRPNNISVKEMAVTSRLKMVKVELQQVEMFEKKLKWMWTDWIPFEDKQWQIDKVVKKWCKGLKRNRVWSVVCWKMFFFFFGESLSKLSPTWILLKSLTVFPNNKLHQMTKAKKTSPRWLGDSVMCWSWFQNFSHARQVWLLTNLFQKRCDSFLFIAQAWKNRDKSFEISLYLLIQPLSMEDTRKNCLSGVSECLN